MRTALYEISRTASAIEATLEGYDVIHYVLIRLPEEIYPILSEWMPDAFHTSNPVSRIESGSIIDALSITKEWAKRNRSGSLTIPPTNRESTIRTINNSCSSSSVPSWFPRDEQHDSNAANEQLTYITCSQSIVSTFLGLDTISLDDVYGSFFSTLFKRGRSMGKVRGRLDYAPLTPK